MNTPIFSLVDVIIQKNQHVSGTFYLTLDHDFWNQAVYELQSLSPTTYYYNSSNENLFIGYVKNKLYLIIVPLTLEFFEYKNEWPTEEFDKEVYSTFVNFYGK